MAEAFANVRLKASEATMQVGQITDQSAFLRELDQRQKLVLSLFKESKFVTTTEIANLINIHPRSSLNLCSKWVDEGFFTQHGTSNKTRKYELSVKWLPLVV